MEKIDIKTIVFLMGSVAVLGGFYYTTQHRLDHLEKITETLSAETNRLDIDIKRIQRKKQKNSGE